MMRVLILLLLAAGLLLSDATAAQAQRGRFRGRGYYGGRPGPRQLYRGPAYRRPQPYYAPRYYHAAPYRPYGGRYYYRPRPYYRPPGPAIIIRP